MMINKRLIGTVSESKKYIAGSVAFQWCALAANICMIAAAARLLEGLYLGTAGGRELRLTAGLSLPAAGRLQLRQKLQPPARLVHRNQAL